MPQSVVTLDFEDLGTTTRLTLTHAGLPDKEDAADHSRGWTSAVEKFGQWIEMREGSGPLVLERVFDAPVALVWQALTEKEKIAQWSFVMTDFKPEVGFEFEFWGQKDDVKYHHRCKVTEAIPHKKLAYTWRYVGFPGDSLVTWELFEEGNKTRVRLTHTGIETFPATEDYARKNFFAGWTAIVGTTLKEFVEKAAAGAPVHR